MPLSAPESPYILGLAGSALALTRLPPSRQTGVAGAAARLVRKREGLLVRTFWLTKRARWVLSEHMVDRDRFCRLVDKKLDSVGDPKRDSQREFLIYLDGLRIEVEASWHASGLAILLAVKIGTF